MSMIAAVLFIVVVYGAILFCDQRFGLLRLDMLDTLQRRIAAYAWLGLFLFFVGLEVIGSSLKTPTAQQLAGTPFYRLFAMHFVLVLFLFVWWLIARRPPVTDYLNIQRHHIGEAVMTGFAVGTGGWIVTVIGALLIGAILSAAGLVPHNVPVPPMILYMAHMALWKRALLVLSAATIEEAFFRGWLQKRIGLLFSTTLFALAHAGYGQPLFLIGVTIVSIVIGTTFYRTKNLIPGIIAHGIFDAVQLFVMIPLVVKLAPQ
jgi:membrane protease YdiL (CAAX protease family)